ncbi:response regulator transcription factor [Segetibacter sp. 3557_3]|uniref:response regulator n=1 Tax=Segetibacter sp. 3557_3 TaxID=2547429 RepID=UPI0010588E31|nr:response regulator transcription factor [Segetibacter sp. 3557_3]TDH28684.1 response regulator transcription factor [Segetibacter sp. 3557_3]
MSIPLIKVTLFEDKKDTRESIQAILNCSPGFTCSGAFANCNNLVKRLTESDLDVVLMDIQMPGISGIEAVAIIRQQYSDVPVLMQTVFEEESKIFAAICAGANGYLLKSTVPSKYIDAIREVAEGGSPMSPVIAAKVLKMFKHQNVQVDSITDYNLSSREQEILGLLVDGLSYKLIAGKLFINYETVHSHVKNIYKKLHVSCVNEAVSKAIRNKLV